MDIVSRIFIYWEFNKERKIYIEEELLEEIRNEILLN